MNQSDINIAIFCGFAVFLMLSSFIVYFVLQYRRNQSQHSLEKKQLHLHFENEINRAQLEMSEHTMQRIASEIHDNIGQSLTLASMNLLDIESQNETLLQSTRELISRSLADLRDLSKSLSQAYQLDLGLSNAIQRELTMIGERGTISCSMEIRNISSSLDQSSNFKPEERDIILFRCVQEALSNVLKYADATQIHVIAYYSGDVCMNIILRDNGNGMDKHTVKKGVGLKSMEERMQLLGGTFQIESEINAGTTLGFLTTHQSMNELMQIHP